MTHEELLQTVAASHVSDAAKEFFQKHRVATGTNLGRAGGWGEEYPLLRELEEAGFIVTYVHFPDSVCNWGSDMESPGEPYMTGGLHLLHASLPQSGHC